MTGSSRQLIAFLDESQSHHDLDPDTYVLAASVCAPAMLEPARDVVSGLRLKGQRKLHWRDESDPRRRLIIRTIAEIPLEHVIVVRDGQAGERPERRRRQCMERMLYELDHLAVATATFESRGRPDDRRDRAMLDAMRARKMVNSELRITHQRGDQEALLWVADALCAELSRNNASGTAATSRPLLNKSGFRLSGSTRPRKDANPGPCRPAGNPEVHFQLHRNGLAIDQ